MRDSLPLSVFLVSEAGKSIGKEVEVEVEVEEEEDGVLGRSVDALRASNAYEEEDICHHPLASFIYLGSLVKDSLTLFGFLVSKAGKLIGKEVEVKEDWALGRSVNALKASNAYEEEDICHHHLASFLYSESPVKDSLTLFGFLVSKAGKLIGKEVEVKGEEWVLGRSVNALRASNAYEEEDICHHPLPSFLYLESLVKDSVPLFCISFVSKAGKIIVKDVELAGGQQEASKSWETLVVQNIDVAEYFITISLLVFMFGWCSEG